MEPLPALLEETIDTEAVASVVEGPEKSAEEKLDELEAHLEREKPEPQGWAIRRDWEDERPRFTISDDD